MSRPEILVLGAGPAGLASAWLLARRGFAVTVLEKNTEAGGNSGSFVLEGQAVDFGSHRLHPSCPPEILDDIRGFLGPALLDRPRHGRIRLHHHWLRFPLKPADLLLHAPPAFALGALRDALWKPSSPAPAQQTFATALQSGLGPTICRDFYFPYAEKIWGVSPGLLDAEQARRRVSAASASSLVRKILSPGAKGRFFYPRHGFGQISSAYQDAASAAGAHVLLGTAASGIQLASEDNPTVLARSAAGEESFRPSLILSTIPLTQLVRLLAHHAPPDVIQAAAALSYRAMLLVYLVLDTERFTEFDAHYFPGADLRITRLSEPKNYSLHGPAHRTVLCAELPCDPGPLWEASNEELGQLVLRDLEAVGLPVPCPVLNVAVRRLPQAYPVYRCGYRESFRRIADWIQSLPAVVTLGRQGLFAHDNTHHTLAMAYAAAACTSDSAHFSRQAWQEHLAHFESFVVED